MWYIHFCLILVLFCCSSFKNVESLRFTDKRKLYLEQTLKSNLTKSNQVKSGPPKAIGAEDLSQRRNFQTCEFDFGNMNIFQLMSLGKLMQGGSSFACGLQAFNSLKSYYIFNNGQCYIPMGTASNNLNLKFPYIYNKVKSPLLLFRVVAESQITSYDYYTSNINYNSDIREPSYMDFNYKSTLLQEWNFIIPKTITVTIKDNVGVIAWLTFIVFKGDKYESWFRQDRLTASYPWNVNLIKSGSYNYFSIKGAKSHVFNRRFYMSRSWSGCPLDFGVLVVLDREDDCHYFPNLNKNFKPPKIIYTVHNNNSGNTNLFSKYGKYLEIWATYEDSVMFMA